MMLKPLGCASKNWFNNMAKFIDLTGKIFGKLTVVERAYPNTKIGTARFLCRCSCGKDTTVDSNALMKGNTKSCGCLKHSYSHGMSSTPEYRAYYAMVNSEWDSFEDFIKDMGIKPSPKHRLVRKNINLPYSKENCEWTTAATRGKNLQFEKQQLEFIEYNGSHISIEELSSIVSINVPTLRWRYSKGYRDEQLVKPIN